MVFKRNLTWGNQGNNSIRLLESYQTGSVHIRHVAARVQGGREQCLPNEKTDMNLPPTGLLTKDFLLGTCFLYKNSCPPKWGEREILPSRLVPTDVILGMTSVLTKGHVDSQTDEFPNYHPREKRPLFTKIYCNLLSSVLLNNLRQRAPPRYTSYIILNPILLFHSWNYCHQKPKTNMSDIIEIVN